MSKEIFNFGSIPEFVKVHNLLDFYKLMTEANLKNKVLNNQDAYTHHSDAENLKNEVILLQFKLIRTSDMQLYNTFSFLNLPGLKSHDVNYRTVAEIIFKLNEHPSFFNPNSSR